MTETNTIRGTTVGRVALRVNDLDQISSFYEQVVGLELQSKDDRTAVLGAGDGALLELVEDIDAPERTRGETGLCPSALFLAADDYHHHVGLNVWNNRRKPAEGRGLAWFELDVPNRETLETIRERFAAREIPVNEGEDEIETADSDGITVRLRVYD
ncbi:VOC family protein [Haladaptatus cibarius]|uniref:VOC family protein n=1 Tax=Haladaptatus cibarius TaxID=453847 RepID=UPI000678BA85|nr:VOC family protein [Haladaptatus cibarius]